MTALAEKITVTEMNENPEKWERFELYRGEPIEMTYSKPLHGKILMQLGTIIKTWIQSSGYGEVMGGESGIRFNENTRYSFDLGWSDTSLPDDEIPSTSLPLMVEIISDSNDASHLLVKIEDYLEYGAKEVWIIYPKRKTIQVYYPDNTARLFHINDTITPGDWMKGFSLSLKDLFPEKKV
jgi:Uma2 family endonuclease